MTEAEWLTSADPAAMLGSVERDASDRKMRLMAVAAARLYWDRMPVGPLRDAVETAERCADGAEESDRLQEYRNSFYRYLTDHATPAQRAWVRSDDNQPLFSATFATTYPSRQRPAGSSGTWGGTVRGLGSALAPLVRCVFRGPDGSTDFDLAWRTLPAVGLAQGIYADRVFDRLPVLADALEDAGCADVNILAHSRGPGPHVRGCWVVDLVLGKGLARAEPVTAADGRRVGDS